MNNDFEYDVAFSFLAEDEKVAFQLHNLLKDTVKSFIYSEQQKKLAGTDGEIRFNQIFSTDSRIVVILYRENWGTTPWTLVEETAIRNRGHDDGYDFTVLIPMGTKVVAPKWFPKSRLWLGLERWGIEHAASIIEARISEYGGAIKTLTTTDKIRISAEEFKNYARRETILLNYEGIQLANVEFDLLIEKFKDEIKKLKTEIPDWKIQERDRTISTGIDIISYNHQLTIQKPNNHYGIDLLSIIIWKGVWPPSGYAPPFDNPISLQEKRFQFDIDQFNQNGWTNKGDRKGFKTSAKLVDEIMNKFFEIVKKYRMSNANRY